MRMNIERRSIEIIPDNKLDEAYIEEVLGLKSAGDYCMCKRENAHGLNCIAYVKIFKADYIETIDKGQWSKP